MSDVVNKVLWSIGLCIVNAIFGTILHKVFQVWGIFDPFSELLGAWLKMHVSSTQVEWTIAGTLALLSYAAMWWIVWRYHRAPRPIINIGDQANIHGIVAGRSRWVTRFGIGIGVCGFLGLAAWFLILAGGR